MKDQHGKHRPNITWTFAGVLRGNTIRGNTIRNSERKMALWEGLWEGLWKTSENLSKPLKTSESLWNSSQRPSQRQISLSEPLSPVDPNRIAPWSFSYKTSSYMFCRLFGLRGLVTKISMGHAEHTRSFVGKKRITSRPPGPNSPEKSQNRVHTKGVMQPHAS